MQQRLRIILFMKLEFWANSQHLQMYHLYLYQHHPSIDPKQILVTISIRNGTFTVMLERKLNWRYQFFASMLGGSSPQSITLTGRHFFRIFNLLWVSQDLSHQTLGILHPSSSHPLLQKSQVTDGTGSNSRRTCFSSCRRKTENSTPQQPR